MTAEALDQLIEHEIGSNGELNLKLIEGRVRLRGVDGTVARVRLSAPGYEDRIGIDRLPGALHIRIPEKFLSVGWLGFDLQGLVARRRGVELDVELPRAATVSIDGASTRIRGAGLVGEQRVHVVSGDVRLEEGGGRINIDGVSGSVTIEANEAVALNVRTVSGDVDVVAPTIRELRLGTMSSDLRAAGDLVGGGPFRIETVSGRALFATDASLRIEARTMSGEVRSERPAKSETIDGRRILTIGAGGPTIAFSSMAGSLRVVPRAAGPSPAPAAPGASAPGTGTKSPLADDVEPVASQPAETTVGAEAEADGGQPSESGRSAGEGRLRILRALERGEIDVEEASRRLQELDGNRG